MQVCASNEWTFTMEKLSVSVAATDPNASEAGPDPATFTANISGPISSDSPTLCVYYAMSGTATPTTDYTMDVSSFTFTPGGSTSATATLTPVRDDLNEGDETADLTLSVPTSVSAGATTKARVTIADDPVVIVNYWHSNLLGGSFGHLSLTLPDATYISWWPSPRQAISKAQPDRKYVEDRRDEGFDPRTFAILGP